MAGSEQGVVMSTGMAPMSTELSTTSTSVVASDSETTPSVPGAAVPSTTHQLITGDARQVLRQLEGASVDLIVTSPPYGQARAASYGGVDPEDYVAWFLPIAAELERVLKPTGTFILNIREGCVRGERSTYVLELILALRRQGWRWTEEFIWHKRQCYPGKWPNRFRNAWERLLQFNLQADFAMYQEAVRVPARAGTLARSRSGGTAGQLRVVSGSGSGLTMRVGSCLRLNAASGLASRTLVYPDNVLHLAVETRPRGHPAAFPESVPDWFIRLFTKPGDVVLDPFMGSGTTNAVAKRLGRHSIGIDAEPRYVRLARERVAAVREPAGSPSSGRSTGSDRS